MITINEFLSVILSLRLFYMLAMTVLYAQTSYNHLTIYSAFNNFKIYPWISKSAELTSTL